MLASRRHEGPLVVQKALHPEGPAVCHALVVHPPAGMAGGDELSLSVRLAQDACALVTTPGAGKWYRSTGRWARQRVRIEAAAGSTMEWLPQESIVYDGALADLAWEAHLDNDARLLAWDICCLGRTGSGERFDRGTCRLASRIFRGGKLAWVERGRIEPGGAVSASAAGLAGAPVFGTLVASAPETGDDLLAACRSATAAEGECGVTRLPGLLVARYRGRSSEAARQYFTALWSRMRGPLLGRAAVEPRIWQT